MGCAVYGAILRRARLAGELLKISARTDLLHIPYKGCAPAMTDVLGGQADVSINTLTNALPYLNKLALRIGLKAD
ncbi:tripartite tricarboxylate transporter substrate-binding protein [Cupriavidus basilensis]|uniref:tripartite tricarboxylate transporter substrate-binding protein n=1 Tax=Cupriavidus basilensis TaxID=68895 RepID=UPI003AF376C2